jgi:hypothetical protein
MNSPARLNFNIESTLSVPFLCTPFPAYIMPIFCSGANGNSRFIFSPMETKSGARNQVMRHFEMSGKKCKKETPFFLHFL